MGAKQMGPPQDLIDCLRSEFSPSVFIETGTYRGHTAAWASSRFDHVYTIEAYRPTFEKAVAEHRHLENVSFLFGRSPEVLSKVLDQIENDAVIWLDAHWMGQESYGPKDECPVLAEINEINRSSATHFILIDDARLFLAPPPLPHDIEQWPTIGKVLAELDRKPRYTVVVDDVIVSVPMRVRAAVSTRIQQRSTDAWHGSQGNAPFLGRWLPRLKRICRIES